MNKKRRVMMFCIILGIISIGIVCSTLQAGADRDVSIVFDGEIHEKTGATLVDGQWLVPLSFLGEVFGVNTEWTEPEPLASGTYYTDRVAVLMYHHIMEEPTQSDIISAAQFERQMELLKTNGFEVIDLEQYTDFILHGASVPDNAVLITFDDGYASFYEHAYPILKSYGYPAVNFVIVSGVDQPERPGIPKLTWEQMRQMQEDGIMFMNHTYEMHEKKSVSAEGDEIPVTVGQLYVEEAQRQETPTEYKQRVMEDLALAELRLRQELGNTISAFAFPYGAYHAELVEITREVGIEIMFSVKPGINTADDQIGFRINGGRSDLKPKAVIEQLKEWGTQVDWKIKIDGKEVALLTVEGDNVNEPFVSLRQFCELYDIEIEWDKRAGRVLMTSSES